MAGRRIFNEQDARRCLAAAKSAPGGLAGWARAHGVDGRSLNLWRVNLGRRGVVRVRSVAPRLVELVPVPARPAVAREPYLLRVGASSSRSATISTGSLFDVSWVCSSRAEFFAGRPRVHRR